MALANLDLNDLSAWLTATGNVDLLRQFIQAGNARLADLQTAQLGGEGAQLVQPHVQPTDVMRPGPLAGMPMVGPVPALSGGQDLRLQAAVNQDTERGQREAGGRGIGPDPVAVNIGPTSEKEEPQVQQITQQRQEQAKQDQQRMRQQIQAAATGKPPEGGQQGAQGGGEETQKLQQRVQELEKQLKEAQQASQPKPQQQAKPPQPQAQQQQQPKPQQQQGKPQPAGAK
jgi:hypothetical protein